MIEEKIILQVLAEQKEYVENYKPENWVSRSEEQLSEFADSVMENQGRLMANNFVELDRDRVYKIYKELW